MSMLCHSHRSALLQCLPNKQRSRSSPAQITSSSPPPIRLTVTCFDPATAAFTSQAAKSTPTPANPLRNFSGHKVASGTKICSPADSASLSRPSTPAARSPSASMAAAAAASGPVRVMVVSDLDNTMVDHKDASSSSLQSFGKLWESAYSGDSLLVYSTGRSPTLYRHLKTEKPLLTPDVVICSVGTEICIGPDMVPDQGWEKLLDQGWDRGAVVEEAAKFPQLKPQADTEQRPHKVSFHLNKEDAPSVVDALTARLKERGLKAKTIYSGGYDLDILPQGAGKGRALEYFLSKLKGEGRHPGKTLVCGDSGNDIELFTIREDGVYGVIVGGAMEELVSWHRDQPPESAGHIFKATERCAAGIMQAMEHFKFPKA